MHKKVKFKLTCCENVRIKTKSKGILPISLLFIELVQIQDSSRLDSEVSGAEDASEEEELTSELLVGGVLEEDGVLELELLGVEEDGVLELEDGGGVVLLGFEEEEVLPEELPPGPTL